MEKERWKIEELVLDKNALLVISRMMKKGLFKSIDFPISTGKEAVVFRVTVKNGKEPTIYGALKVYKIETTSFINRTDYLYGDKRFEHVKKNLKDIVYAFTKKEYKNLVIAEKANVNAPRPFYQEKNVILMSFLGENGIAYTPLYKIKDPDNEYFYSIIEDVKKLYKAGIVHSDLSEFNILIGDKPYLIDFAQGVLLSHPKAEQFLENDINNILRFFKKTGKINMSLQEVLSYVKNN
jgi:RIO kinase 1